MCQRKIGNSAANNRDWGADGRFSAGTAATATGTVFYHPIEEAYSKSFMTILPFNKTDTDKR
jgi:hypothetical protein